MKAIASAPDEKLIDAFCDRLWLQDGLAQASLASYRRDLAAFDAWTARPRDAGDALCDRLARLGARRIEVDAGRLERRHRARDGQRQQGATRSARRGGGRMAAALCEARAPAPCGFVNASGCFSD